MLPIYIQRRLLTERDYGSTGAPVVGEAVSVDDELRAFDAQHTTGASANLLRLPLFARFVYGMGQEEIWR